MIRERRGPRRVRDLIVAHPQGEAFLQFARTGVAAAGGRMRIGFMAVPYASVFAASLIAARMR